jgi:cell pole-organizing protein PopZ
MTDTSAQEPTMEEILASIRRIISEDDTPAVAPEPAPVAAAPAAEPAPPPIVEPDPSDVLELTDPVTPPMAAPVLSPPPPLVVDDIEVAEPPPPKAPVLAALEPEEGLLSDRVAQTAADHFGSLASSLLMPAEGRTLEDVVKELLRPLLKDWLDTHLAAIVEATVQSEVERISRRRI